MNKKPIAKSEILKELNEYQNQDYKYESGRILGSMCTQAHPFAKEVFIQFLDSNLGDAGLFQGTKAIENEAIKTIGSFLGNPNVFGNIVTGGTEANLMAMRGARNLAINNKGIKNGEIIVPESAHFSFKKAQDMLGLKVIKVPLDESYKTSTDFVQDHINKNTVAIVGVAGSTELGMIDPIKELSDISIDADVHLHVDAAFGGFVIPFLKDLGYDFPDFDFSLPGVDSMTVDPHKMGLAPIPAGCILFKNHDCLDAMAVDTPYLTYKQQSTIVGTRLGASSAAIFALMKYLGREGYAKFAEECMENTRFLSSGLKDLGYELVCEPKLNIIGFNHPKLSTKDLAGELEKREWRVSMSKCPEAVRIIMMRHIKHDNIVDLLSDLEDIKNNL
jgi:tyrosine decarboxylase/aspartate 1-decarboxylase